MTGDFLDSESALCEHRFERTRGKKSDVRISPRLCCGALITNRIPSPQQNKIKAPSPSCDVRHSKDDFATRSKNTHHLSNSSIRREQVFQHLNAHNSIKRF